MANPRTPTPLKVVIGTFRNDRANPNEPATEVKIPDTPKHLSRYAGEEWRRIAPILETMGLVSDSDRSALAMYCQAWGDHVKAEYMIRKHGHVIQTTNGNQIQSPWVGISNTSKLIAHKFLVEFGLTPASRSKVSATPKKDTKPEGKERFFK